MTFTCAILTADRPGATRCTVQCATCAALDPEPPRTRPRDIADERRIAREVSQARADTTHIIRHAQARAEHLSSEYVRDPMLVALADHLTEAREELADAHNRLVWWLQENSDDEFIGHGREALALIGLAYELIRSAQDD